jgi:hypothetical protein
VPSAAAAGSREVLRRVQRRRRVRGRSTGGRGGLGGGGGGFGGGGSELSAAAEDSVWFEGGRRSWVFNLWGVVGVSEAGELRPLEIVEKAHGIRGGFGRRF